MPLLGLEKLEGGRNKGAGGMESKRSSRRGGKGLQDFGKKKKHQEGRGLSGDDTCEHRPSRRIVLRKKGKEKNMKSSWGWRHRADGLENRPAGGGT